MAGPEASPEEIAAMRPRWNRVESVADLKGLDGLGDVALGGVAAAQEQIPESNDK